jgi:diguanylate cyclase (GGDEF)-like protein
MRLSTRSQLIFLGILILAFIMAGTNLVISMQRRAAIGAFATATTNLANGMSRQTTYFMTQADRVLKTVHTFVTPSPGSDPPAIDARMRSPAAFGLLSNQIARISGVDALILVGADGKVANSSQGWPATPVDVSGQDYFSHFKAHDDAALFAGNPVRDPATGAWTLPLARRVDAANGAFAGVVVAELSLKDLAAFYQLAMPAHRTLSLARRDGLVLLHYPAGAGDIGRRIPVTSPWYSIVAQGGGVYDAPAYFSSAPVIAVVRPLPDLPFVVETSVAQSDALLQWAHERYWVVLGGIFSAVCAISVLWLFGRQFRRIELSERILAAKNAELDITHQQLEVTLANLVQGVCLFDENNKLLVFNRRFCQLLGLPGEQVRIGMPVAEIVERCIAAGSFWNATVEEYLTDLDARIRAGLPTDEVFELPDGRTVSRHFEPLAGHGWLMTLEDISERRVAEQKIAYLANHDLLTGLANRSLFHEQLGQALVEAASNKGFAMLYLDLDRFKAVNDSFGHPVGDSLLRIVADRLRAAVRDRDTVVRMGGDEFVILQRNVSDRAETIVLADRIIEAIGTPFIVEGHRLSIGVSIGITMAPSDQMSPERLLHDADLALYRAKQAGRGTWRIFDPKMAADANARSATEIALLDEVPQDRA